MSFKRFLIIVVAFAMMFGAGYAGAQFANYMHDQTDIAAESIGAVQAYMPQVTQQVADGVFEMVASAVSFGDTLELPDIFDGANPAVVAISTEILGRNAFGATVSRPASGSGFLVSPDGYIVTNEHVIEGANSITVLMYDGRALPATVIGADAQSDIAVIKIEQNALPYLSFADSSTLRVGEQVAAIGNPLGELANSLTVGHISALDRYITTEGITRNKIQTDAAVNRGNSGGPLLNMQGQVVGVVSAKSVGVDVEGLGFAIPSSYAQTVVSQLIEYGFVRGRAILGVTIMSDDASGLVQVASVSPGSGAAEAGIQPGDIILSANGIAIESFADLRRVLDASAPGDVLQIAIRRGNVELLLTATLGEHRPPGV